MSHYSRSFCITLYSYCISSYEVISIKSLTHILTKHLTGLGQMWTKYLSLATFAYNTFNSSNLGNYSPSELTFGRKLKVLLNTETNPDIKVSTNFGEYYNLLNKRIKYLQDILFNFKSRRIAMINQNRENVQYEGRDLSILYHH